MKYFRTPRFLKWAYPKRTWSFSVSEPYVYLTFDDGPIPEVTPIILDFLSQNNLKATFFCVGENVKKYPTIFERIIREGHTVGNHTQFHNNAHKTHTKEYLKSLIAGKVTTSSTLFRPPYGRLSIIKSKRIAKENSIIMWSFLTYDWDQSVKISTVRKKLSTLKAGDIVVLHDNIKSKDRVIPILKELVVQMELKQLTSRAILPEYVKRK